jgi:hypothetical protein
LEPGDTPYEFTGLLSARLQELASLGIATHLGVEIAQDVRSLVDTIVFTSYNPAHLSMIPDAELLHRWRQLRWRLTWLRFIEKRQALVERFKVLTLNMGYHKGENDQED